MKQEMVCINCPRGCHLTVEKVNDDVKVSGNACKKGLQFGIQELTKPMRTIASTVKTTDKDNPVLSVRVSKEIPKDMIFTVMQAINKVHVKAPIAIGDTIIQNVCNTGADIIATSPLKERN